MMHILLERIKELEDHLVEAHARITRLEAQHERTFRFGKVTDVDGQKMRIRMEIAPPGDDGTPVKSDFIPYSQVAGARKIHSMPSSGQQMVMIAPDGDFQQAFCVPLFWSDSNQSPSNDPNAHVDQVGATKNTQTDGTWTQETKNAKMAMSEASIIHSAGSSTSVALTDGKLTIKAALIDLNPS